MLSLTRHARIPSAVLAIVAALSVAFAFAQDGSVSLSPAALREIAQVEAEIDRIEAQALGRHWNACLRHQTIKSSRSSYLAR
jgi:hypothetical protein